MQQYWLQYTYQAPAAALLPQAHDQHKLVQGHPGLTAVPLGMYLPMTARATVFAPSG